MPTFWELFLNHFQTVGARSGQQANQTLNTRLRLKSVKNVLLFALLIVESELGTRTA